MTSDNRNQSQQDSGQQDQKKPGQQTGQQQKQGPGREAKMSRRAVSMTRPARVALRVANRTNSPLLQHLSPSPFSDGLFAWEATRERPGSRA